MVADDAIMRDMGVGHDQRVAANASQSAALDGAAVDGDKLANLVVVANLEARRFTGVSDVLRRHADRSRKERSHCPTRSSSVLRWSRARAGGSPRPIRLPGQSRNKGRFCRKDEFSPRDRRLPWDESPRRTFAVVLRSDVLFACGRFAIRELIPVRPCLRPPRRRPNRHARGRYPPVDS